MEKQLLVRRGSDVETLVRGNKSSLISSEDLMYNMVTVINDNAFYIWNLLRVDLKVLISLTHKHTHKG